MKKQFLLLTVLLFLLGACAPKPAEHSFIKVNADGQFVRDGKPYYFVGANFWYGAILGSEGEGGNRERLHKEPGLSEKYWHQQPARIGGC